MKIKIGLILFLLLAIAGAVASVMYYPYVFAKNVQGEVTGVERVTEPQMIVGNVNPANVFSFAIALRSFKDGEVYTSSTEDRRWGVVAKGQCAEVRLFRYPPWDLEKGGTFFGARLIRVFDCPDASKDSEKKTDGQPAPKAAETPAAAPAPAAPPASDAQAPQAAPAAEAAPAGI